MTVSAFLGSRWKDISQGTKNVVYAGVEEMRKVLLKEIQLLFFGATCTNDGCVGKKVASSLTIASQLYCRTGSTGYRFVSQYKSSLLHVYSHLGALPQMLTCPLWEDINDLLKDYLKFMDDCQRESADLTFLAYRHHTYPNVIEFVQFKERLQHSNHQYLFARVESSILRLKEKADNIEEEQGVLESLKCGTQILELASDSSCKSLTFNEELHLRPWWTPTPKKNYLLGPCEELDHSRKNSDYMKGWVTNVQETVEKRSLLPRMIYLSLQCVSNSIKESVEANGSVSDSSFSLEMKSLLHSYVKTLGCSLDEAVEVVVDVAEGQRSLEALGSDLIGWVNFAVFFNAWSLSSSSTKSSLPIGEASKSSWHVLNSLLQKCVLHKVKMKSPMFCSLGRDLQALVQLIAEPVAWHCLVLQSYFRSSLLCGKKSGGPAESSETIRDSISSLYKVVEVAAKCLKEEVHKTDDEAVDHILSSIMSGSNEGLGQVFQLLKDSLLQMKEYWVIEFPSN